MIFIVFGVSHQTAATALREKIAFSNESLATALTDALNQNALLEVAIISTCNRTEIYACSKQDVNNKLLQWFSSYHGLELLEIKSVCYEHYQNAAIRHIFRVASGLDSMVVGETQILGQIKSAYSIARENKTLGPYLERLFQYTFTVAKQIHSETRLGGESVSVASIALSLASKIFSDLSRAHILLLGAGETIELLARFFTQKGVRVLTVANRTLANAEQLALKIQARAIPLGDVAEYVKDVDIIISSTASTLPIVGKGMIEAAQKKRKNKPIFMIDLAVPRDIEPEVADLDDVYLYTLDDLQDLASQGMKSRCHAATSAEKIVGERVVEFMQQLRLWNTADLLKRYRRQGELIREEALQKALKALAKGENPEQVLQRLSVDLINKMLHEPTVQLRKMAAEGGGEALSIAKTLFGLQDDNISKNSKD